MLCEIHDPATARRIARKLEWVYTPKHGSWLHSADIEFGVLTRQCLGRRLADEDTLRTEVEAWARCRNRQGAPVLWRFTTADAQSSCASCIRQFRSVHTLHQQEFRLSQDTALNATLCSQNDQEPRLAAGPGDALHLKGSQWHFGMDWQIRLIPHVGTTPAQVHDSQIAPRLLHGRETEV